jgi:putative DNA primase/helicase
MRRDYFTFKPTFKLIIAGNHKPTLRSVDEANRRRFNIIPFTNKPTVADKQLFEKLKAEWPGILRWCRGRPAVAGPRSESAGGRARCDRDLLR